MVYVDAGVQNDASQNSFSVTEYILGIINIVSDTVTYGVYSYMVMFSIKPIPCCFADGQIVLWRNFAASNWQGLY